MSFLRQTCRTSHRSISLVERHNSIILTPLSITSTRQQTRHFSENTRRRALNQRQHVYKTFQGQFPPDIHSQAQILSRARRRQFSSSNPRCHGHLDKPKPGEERHVTFIDKEGDSHVFEVADGDNLLDIAQANDLEMEGMYRAAHALLRCIPATRRCCVSWFDADNLQVHAVDPAPAQPAMS